MKTITLLSAFLLFAHFGFSQSTWVCGNTSGGGSPRQVDCNETSADFQNHWKLKESYIPSPGSSLDFIKTVHVSFPRPLKC